MTEHTPPSPSENGPLSAIRAFAAAEAAELADLGALLSQLRAALPEPPDPDRVIDADAVWQRVLQRLDRPRDGA